MHNAIARCFLLLTRLFYRRIEIRAAPRAPGPVVYAVNHPNALLDGGLLLAAAREPVAFLAKEPLLRMPILGWLARRMGCLPVYRSRDGNDPRGNRLTLAAARKHIAQGSSIAIFPEGTSHCHEGLLPLRSGAARLALASSVAIVPVALRYEDKGRFRSSVVIELGSPIAPAVALAPSDEEPPATLVRQTTAQLSRELAQLLAKPAPTPTRGTLPIVLLPFLALTLVHLPVQGAIRAIARHGAQRARDLEATLKLVSATVLLPLGWSLALASLAAATENLAWMALLLVLPLAFWLTVRARDAFDDLATRR